MARRLWCLLFVLLASCTLTNQPPATHDQSLPPLLLTPTPQQSTTTLPPIPTGKACTGLLDFPNSRAVRGDHISNFHAAIYEDSNGYSYPYQLYIPDGIEADKCYPLVLALHGNGRRGSDNTRQLQLGTVTIWHNGSRNRQQELTYILAPQLGESNRWTEPEHVQAVIRLVEAMIATYPVDVDRVYINGYSMGANATLHIIRESPELWAAAGVVSGFVHAWPRQEYEKLLEVPLWVFASEDDEAIEYGGVLNMMKLLWQLKGNEGTPDSMGDPDLKFTTFSAEQGLGHRTDVAATRQIGYKAFFYEHSR